MPGRGYADALLSRLAVASRSVDVLMYQWTFSAEEPPHVMQRINLALQSASARGVKIRALLHTGNASDKLRGVNGRAEQQLVNFGARVKRWHAKQSLHAKLVLVDQTHALLGSHNFSLRSMQSNIETSVLITGADEVRPLQTYFNLLFGQV